LQKVYTAAPTVYPQIGWAVDPDAVTAAGTTEAANPEWFDHREAERTFHRALVTHRYLADVDKLATLTRTAADHSRSVAAELSNWSSK
jgi:hypothetical protein